MKCKIVLFLCLFHIYRTRTGVLKTLNSSAVLENESDINTDSVEISNDTTINGDSEIPEDNTISLDVFSIIENDSNTRTLIIDNEIYVDSFNGTVKNETISLTKLTPARIISTLAYTPKLGLKKIRHISKNDLFTILGIPKIKKVTKIKQTIFKNKKIPNKILRSKRDKNKQQDHSDILTDNELVSVFMLARPAEIAVQRCSSPEYTIVTKCMSNLAQIVITSELKSTNGIVHIYPKGKTHTVRGIHTTLYLVWKLEHKQSMVYLQANLTASNLENQYMESQYLNLKQLQVLLYFWEDGDYSCLADINCGTEWVAQRVGMQSLNNEAKSHIRSIIASSISLYGEGHELINGNDTVAENKLLKIFIRAIATYNKNVEIFVNSCDLLLPEQDPIPILVGGCTVSKCLRNFEMEPWLGHLRADVKALSSYFTTFHLPNKTNFLQIGCQVLVCKGLCGINSSCQKTKPSRKVNTEVLKKFYLTAGFHQGHNVETEVKDSCDHITSAEFCITSSICFGLLMLISFVYLIFLYFCYMQAKRHTDSVRKTYSDEVESPLRSLISDYSTTRKRSPTMGYVY